MLGRTHALQSVAASRTMADGRSPGAPRLQATLLRATCWAAALAATLALGDRAACQVPANVTFNPSATPAGASWNLGTNWSTSSLPTAIDTALIGAANGDGLITLDASQSVAGLSYTKTGTTVLTGNALSTDTFRTLTLGTAGIAMNTNTGVLLVGGTSNSTASPDFQQIQLVLGGNQTWQNNSVTPRASSADPWSLFRGLTPSTVVDQFGDHTLTITGAGWTELRGRFTGTTASRIVMDGAGGVLAIGSNAGANYAGSFEIKNGALGIANGSAVLGTGTLRITGGQIFPYLADRTITNAMAWGGDFTVRDPRRDVVNDFRGHVLTATGSTVLEKSVIVNVDNDGLVGTTVGGFSVGAIGDGGGNFGITKAGPGLLAFTGTNTYGGNTTVTNGGLSIAQTGSLPGWDQPGRYSITGSTSYLAFGDAVTDENITTILGTGNLAADVSLGFNTAANRSYAANLSGSRGLVKLGAAELTVSGTNTYAGNTRVLQGTLRIPSTSALPGWNSPGKVAVTSGAALVVENGVSTEDVATILSSGTFAAGSQIGFDTSSGERSTTPVLSGDVGLRKAGVNSLILGVQSTNSGTLTIAGGAVQAAVADVGSTSGPLGLGPIVFAGGALQYSAANQTDYSPRFTADTQVYAADTNGQDVTWSRAFTLGTNGGISKSGAGTLTLSTGTVTVGTSGLAASGGTLSMGSLSITSAGGVLFDVTGGGRLEVTGTVAPSGSAQNTPLALSGNGDIVFSGAISNLGSGAMTISGGATVSFPSGTTNANRGQLLINDGVAVGQRLRNQDQSSSFGNPNNSAARQVIRMGNGMTSGTLRTIHSSDETSNRQIQIGSGSGTGGAAIERFGSSFLTLTGSAGWLNVQDIAATSPRTLTLGGESGRGNTISGGIRDNNTADGGTVSLVKAGGGRWILSGTNTYTGNTTISQGTLEISTTAALPGWNTVGRFAVQPGARLTLPGTVGAANIDTMLGTVSSNFLPGSTVQIDTSTAGLTLSAAVPSGINLAKAGANTLTLTGVSSPASTTIAAGGTLEVGAGGTTGSLSGNVANSGTLAFNRSDDVTFSGTVSGAGVLTKSGAGKLTLSANNTFTGATTVNQGTLEVSGFSDSSSTIFLSGSDDSGTFRYVGASNLVLANRQVQVGNVASGTGSAVILSDGAGTLSFTTAAFSNTFGGATAARSLVLGGTNTGGNTIAGTIADNSATGIIGLSKQGSGTWILSGANTYTGQTSVEAGILFVNGSLGSGAVTVASGATLAGSGTLENVVAINGIHSPGASPGLQTFTNNLNYNATGSLIWELAGNTDLTADRGTVYDGVDVTGSGGQLAINTAAPLALVFDAPLANADPSTVNFTNAFWDSDRTWQVISLAGGATGDNNVFGTISVGADASGNVLSTVRPTASFSVTSQPDGVYLLYAAVPEPAIALLWIGGGAVLGLVARSRRRPA